MTNVDPDGDFEIVPEWKEVLDYLSASDDSLFSQQAGKSLIWHYSKAGFRVGTAAVNYLFENDQLETFGADLLGDMPSCLVLKDDRPALDVPRPDDNAYECGESCPLGCDPDDPPPCGAPCVVKCKNHDGENGGAWCIKCLPAGMTEAARAGTIAWIGEKP